MLSEVGGSVGEGSSTGLGVLRYLREVASCEASTSVPFFFFFNLFMKIIHRITQSCYFYHFSLSLKTLLLVLMLAVLHNE